MLKEVRCLSCNKLLFKVELEAGKAVFQTVCPKCKAQSDHKIESVDHQKPFQDRMNLAKK